MRLATVIVLSTFALACGRAPNEVVPRSENALPSSELVAFRDAFRAMRGGETEYVLTDGNREYDFGRFSVPVADPPPWLGQ